MLSKQKQTLANYKKKRAISQKISYFGVVLIAFNYLILIVGFAIYSRSEYNKALYNWTIEIIPFTFLVGICVILLVALIWICRMFSHDK
jgi:hypothetical protein